MVKMKENRVLPLLAFLCLVFSGIHRMDAQEPEDSADLVFLIDGSNNVGRTGFTSIRDFLVNYVERRLEIGKNRMQVGVVQFSDDVKIEFTLDEHTTKSGLINAMKNLRFSGGEESNMGAAVEYVVEQLFSAAGGSRRDEGVPQSLVVITGGPSSDDLRDAANALKLNSIITFGIGVERADNSELVQIATDDSFVFTAPQIRIIGQLENQIVPYIAGVAQRTIVLQAPTIITEVTEVNKRDIVFLIDSSSDMGGPSYSAIREFIVKLVNRLEIGLDLIRVGVAQYARDVKPEFQLNVYGAKKDIIAHLKKMRIMNTTPLNTAAALSYVQTNFFTASAGSRADEGIPQLLVLITGGKSRDDISQVSQSLKRAGILTFTVGAKNAEDDELQQIAFDSSLVFKPTEFRQVPLQSLLPQVLAPLRTLTGVVITEGPTEGQNILLFPKQSVTDYVILRPAVEQAVKQLTVCLRSYTDLHRGHSLFSLATPEKNNAFLIYLQSPKFCHVYINQEKFVFEVDPEVLDWKQTCVAWDSETGLLQLWVDSKRYPRRVTASRFPIGPQMSVILGQEQDSFGGKFDAGQSFVGEMSDVNMWDHVLSTKTIANNYLYESGNIFSWTNGTKEIRGGVMALEN